MKKNPQLTHLNHPAREIGYWGENSIDISPAPPSVFQVGLYPRRNGLLSFSWFCPAGFAPKEG